MERGVEVPAKKKKENLSYGRHVQKQRKGRSTVSQGQ